MRTATFATALAFVMALAFAGDANAQATTTPGAPSTGFESSMATSVTLGVTALAAVLGVAYLFGRKRA